MTNGGTNHALCAFALWEKEMAVQQLVAENAALKQEVERLKGETDAKPVRRPRAVQQPQGS